jgi:putative N6-adenine-specific DNA methylase
VDKLLRIYGARPDSGPLKDKIVIYIYWKNENCFIYLDTSGQPLSRRNWRKIPYLAPLNETLAAGIIFATGWDIKTNFINPMCGSGTLAIEAALMSLKRAPSCARENFSFMHFKNYAPGVWQEIKEQARKRENSSVNLRIIATDINAKAIEASRKNAKAAGVENYIDFEICDFAKTDVTPGTGVVVVNPGYGIRLGEIAHLERLYAKIGDFFKQKCQGYRGYIFSANTSLLKKVGLRPAKKIIFYNAEIECRLYEYPLYKGKANIQKP